MDSVSVPLLFRNVTPLPVLFEKSNFGKVTVGKSTSVLMLCKNSKRLLKFGRCKLGAMVQWITGFCNLMMHRHRKHRFIDPTCRRCELTEETPIHLTWECPALYGARVDCLREWDRQVLNPLLEPEQVVPWNPEQIYKFIVESNSEVLLVDNEEY